MLKHFFERITLFTVLACLSLVVFIIVAISREAAIIKQTLLYHLGISVFVFAGIDVLLKQVLKLKTAALWAIQIFLLLVAVYVWIVSE